MARRSQISAALLTLMAGEERHAWTLEELHAGLARDKSAADFSSVFRAAEKLAADGSVRKLRLDDGRARYERITARHDHLHCTRCGALIPVACMLDDDAFAALEGASGFLVTERRVVLNGLCAACRLDGESQAA
jgi:Fe2+ or Zn2+ uptake regulation protein